MSDTMDRLKAGIGDFFRRHGFAAEFEKGQSRAWASITFSGERHGLTFRVRGRAPIRPAEISCTA